MRSRQLALLVPAAAAVASLWYSGSAAVAQGPPDLIFFNGKIVTVDRTFSSAEAVAIGGGKFVAVGTDAAVRKLAGHEYILNSAALKKWTITRDTPEPAGGRITRDADGELNGELVDRAKALVQLPPAPARSLDQRIEEMTVLMTVVGGKIVFEHPEFRRSSSQ